MCGIFFIKNRESANCDNSKISKLFYKIQNRGPDNSSLNFYYDYAIGFHRLSINGLNKKSNQPFNKNGIYAMCNGEIYNFKEIYDELDLRPETDSDCEVIIDLYQKFCKIIDKKIVIDYICKKLDGVFSFIIYDTNTRDIFAARDPYGVRPLFYNDNPDGEITDFCSELKGLNFGGDYNNNNKQFPPGHYICNNNIYRYHSFGNIEINIAPLRLLNKTYEYYCNIVKNALILSVRKRLLSDRPIACLLSGGLDSSLITSIVARLENKQIETYSIGLPGATDLKYAQEVANFLGTKHTEIIVDKMDFISAIPETIKRIESYDTTTVRASVGNYLVAKYISENSDAKVIFNGDGADELMGGYLYFHKAPTNIDFDYEIHKLLNNIHYFDVLRSDRSISSCGLEPRTPFLDKNFVNTYLSVPIEYRRSKEQEKKLVRDAFIDFLPTSVLHRRKEAFSDGVSAETESWFEIIQNYIQINNLVKNEMFEKYKYEKYNFPNSQEKIYYRNIFDSIYPNSGHIIPYFWMPNWSDTNDPSARTL